MSHLSDRMLDHLREVTERPDLSGTRYEVEDEIGRGGMGVVYKARDKFLRRSVALKVIDEFCDISEDEARIIARLEHPGIVPLYDAGPLPDGRAYYAMKLVEGVTLDQFLLRETALPERLRVFQRICEAVAFAHSRGVVHRDLKPQNVMIGAFGEVLVMDWGVARRLEDPEPAGMMVGTPRYIPPEQGCRPCRDVYALGALLEDLLADEKPRALVAIVAKAKATAPESRYPSATELAVDISRFLNGDAVTAYRETVLDRAARFGRRNSTLLLLIAAYVIVRVIFLIIR